jgi:hypothetical protein
MTSSYVVDEAGTFDRHGSTTPERIAPLPAPNATRARERWAKASDDVQLMIFDRERRPGFVSQTLSEHCC